MIQALNASSSLQSFLGLSFPALSGIKYFLPGRTSLTELVMWEICLMLSMMVKSRFSSMIFEYLPISSATRYFSLRSPISSKCSMAKTIILSSPPSLSVRSVDGWNILTTLPPPICFLKLIQKLGALTGESMLSSLMHATGVWGFAEMLSLSCFLLHLSVKSSSSFSG